MIGAIEQEAFHSSQIAKLVLKGNWQLTELHPHSFLHVDSLRKL